MNVEQPFNSEVHIQTLRPSVRIALLIGGTVSVILAVIATLLPVIPTTPFVLLAAVCYGRSSERLYRRLMNSRLIGENYHNLREGRGLPLRVKLSALLLAWIMLGLAAIYMVESAFMKAFLISLAVIKTFVMMKIKTLKLEYV
jgi:uncharacterized membrane protein YbaN (DUF454 family)